MSIPPNATPLPGSKNLHIVVDDTKLFIYSDLAQNHGISTSGKSLVIASSSGNKPIGSTNAFLGLNLFSKGSTPQEFDDKATADLREMTTMGDHCEWCVDGKILCIKIDFKNIGNKVASSGKSTLLASSSGNKAVGNTGIMCGMNCYVPVGKKFQIEKLSSIVKNNDLSLGQNVDLGDGFTIQLESEKQVTVHFECDKKGANDLQKMPPFSLSDGVAISCLVKMSDKKKKVEAQDNTKSKSVDFTSPSTKSKNLMVRLGFKKENESKLKEQEEKEEEEECSTIILDLRFDPTKTFGLSTTGKTTTVSSSGGWCSLGNGISFIFNAYKAGLHVASPDIEEAVSKVLRAHSKEEVTGLSFKSVMTEVGKELGLEEPITEDIKQKVKEAVLEYLKSYID